MSRNRSLKDLGQGITYGNAPLPMGMIPQYGSINTYTEGRFKVVELNIMISSTIRATVVTGTRFFSGDIGSSKMVINLFMDGRPLDLRDLANYNITFDFPQLDVGTITLQPVIIDPAYGSAYLIIPDIILNVGNTDMLQYINLEFNNGQYLDAGVFSSSVETSFIDRESIELEERFITRFDELREIMETRVAEFEVKVDEGLVELDNISTTAINTITTTANNAVTTVTNLSNSTTSQMTTITNNAVTTLNETVSGLISEAVGTINDTTSENVSTVNNISSSAISTMTDLRDNSIYQLENLGASATQEVQGQLDLVQERVTGKVDQAIGLLDEHRLSGQATLSQMVQDSTVTISTMLTDMATTIDNTIRDVFAEITEFDPDHWDEDMRNLHQSISHFTSTLASEMQLLHNNVGRFVEIDLVELLAHRVENLELLVGRLLDESGENL